MNNNQTKCEDVVEMYRRKEISYNNMLWRLTQILGNNVTIENQKNLTRIITPEEDIFVYKYY
jgi:hypothetical protein